MSLSEIYFTWFWWCIVVLPVLMYGGIIALTTFTPRSVIDRYVRPPHFTEFESVAYRHFPSSWIRTLLFSVAISFPFFRRFRHFGPIYKNVPMWFNLACRFYVYVVLGALYSWILMAALMISFPDFFK